MPTSHTTAPVSSTPRRRWLRWLAVACGLALGASLGAAYALHQLWLRLPAVDHLADYTPDLPLRIYARDGSLLAEYGQERRELVPIAQIPVSLRQALLAIEDANFYDHRGVDYGGIARAALSNLRLGARGQGGSTITMQVARVFFLSRDKTYARKLTEVLLAYKLEAAYPKDKLLELYMNQVYLGERAYGFAAAADVYFDKTLDELSVAESAMLAGLPKAPSAYNPVANRARAVQRQRHILQRMASLQMLEPAQLQAALDEPLQLAPRQRGVSGSADFATELARQFVVDQFGDAAYTRGLDVVTTIDPDLQGAATQALRDGLLRTQAARGETAPEGRIAGPLPAGDAKALRRALAPWPDFGALRAAHVRHASPSIGIVAELRDGQAVRIPAPRLSRSARAALAADAPKRQRITAGSVVRVQADAAQRWSLVQTPGMEGALVSLDLHGGDILALTGGFDFARNQFDHAVQAYRQPGSTFKPFVYSAALEQGYFPGTLVDDSSRVVVPAARGRKAWRPRNYGHQYEGPITARRGLVRSKNLVAVNLMEAAGITYVHDFATRFGFEAERNRAALPLALGSGAVTPLQLAQAFAVFGNGGHRVQPRLITTVRERHGAVLFAAPAPQREAVVSPRNAHVMDSLLRDVVQHGTARQAAALGRDDVAGKTGTSNDARDAWFAGYAADLATVVWIGYDQPRSLGPRATGGTLALPVWTDYMRHALQDRPAMPRPMPPGLALVNDDFVYAEYLRGACVPARSPHVRPLHACPPWAAPVLPAGPASGL
jgi:penicillin-binding protein 1A